MSASLTRSRLRHAPAWIWAAAIWAESSTTWPSVESHHLLPDWVPTDKVAHMVLFGVLAVLIAAPSALRSRRVWLGAWALAALWGAIDETHQSWVPGRTADPMDWLADLIGAAAGLALLRVWAAPSTPKA